MTMTWQPTAKDMLYARTGEPTWDCTACCLDGHEARAHDGWLNYGWDLDGRITIWRADPCLLLDAVSVEGMTRGTVDSPPCGALDGDLLRIEGEDREGENWAAIYRLTKQPYNDRPSGMTPSVAEVFPPQGDFYLAEWPD